ncbi:MAG: PP2C family protein-serine/threonine phosphatase [bacterium]|nr:PP2C family protein-serine/threonine phosphatase [bacterium]
MQKKLFRTVENLLAQIDHSGGNEQALIDILHLLVESDDTVSRGVVSGRLYIEREKDYKLIKSISGHGPDITGKTVSKEYQVVQDILKHRLWVISPDSPGFDPELEAQFSDVDSAAILIGRDPSYILSLGIRHHGSEDDLRVLLETLRASVGMKLREQALASQMEQARTIQQSLLPAHMPSFEGYDIAARSVPAEEVGGDVYDIQEVEKDVIGLMLADASGHGLPAALQARDVVIGLRMGQAEGEKITGTVSRLNRVIHRSGLTSRFISLFYAELEAAGNMTYVNGGHCPPLLVTPGGDTYELKVSGPVLGPLPDAPYGRGYLTMNPCEILVIFSDGVTERHEPNDDLNDPDSEVIPVEFGREGLIKTIQNNIDNSADEIVEAIFSDVKKFGLGRPFEDDVSVMVIKRLSEDVYPPAESVTLLPTETSL